MTQAWHQGPTWLEKQVGNELERLGAQFTFDLPEHQCSGVYYRPDFKILSAPPELRLPHFVEAKPQEFIYEFFRMTGAERRLGAQLRGGAKRFHITAEEIAGYGVPLMLELAKPKLLAERHGLSVLVVGAVGRDNTMSMTMHPDHVLFEKFHPLVNQSGLQKRRAREERDRIWKEESAARQKQWEQERLEREAAARKVHEEMCVIYRLEAARSFRTNNHTGHCCICGEQVEAMTGILIYYCGWKALHRSCR